MKLVLAAVLCALAVKTVVTMPVAEPGVAAEPLPVLPLEKSATQHVLRRETPEAGAAVPAAAAVTPSVHREGETPEEHAAHAHVTARLDDKLPEGESKKEEPAAKSLEDEKPLPEEKKIVPALETTPEKAPSVKSVASEAVEGVQAAVDGIITPTETLAPIVAASVESKLETVEVVGKSALPQEEINAEPKEEPKPVEPTPKAAISAEEPQPIVESAPVSSESPAPVAAAIPQAEATKEETNVKTIAIEEDKEDMKKVEPKADDKTDRVTRGTGDEAPIVAAPEESAPVAPVAAAPTPVLEVAAAVVESEVKSEEKKEEVAEKKVKAIEDEKKPEEVQPSVQASEAIVEELKPESTAENKVAEPIAQAKSAPEVEQEAIVQAKPEAIAPTTVVKPEPVAETIAVKSEPIEATKAAVVEAVKAVESSSEEKSSEEDKSDENKSSEEKQTAEAKSGPLKKDETKAEELPKPEELIEN